MRCKKYLLTCLLLSSVAACAANNKSEPPAEPPAPATKPMALSELPGVSSPEVLIYFERHTIDNKTWCPKGTAFKGKVVSDGGTMFDVTLPIGIPVDASPEIGSQETMTWVAVDMNGAPVPEGDKFIFGVFFSPLKGDLMRSKYNKTKKRYEIAKEIRITKRLPDNVNYKYTVATLKKNSDKVLVLKDKCEPLDPLIRVLR